MAEIPVFDGLIPASCYKDWGGLPRDVDEAGAADGLVVCCDLLGCSAAGSRSKAGCFVGAGAYYFCAVLLNVLV